MSYSSVQAGIHEAAARAGRAVSTITLIAVTKNHSAEEVRALAAAGHRDFGENRLQEASKKLAEAREPGSWLAPPERRLHLIGHLQSNKAGLALDLFDTIHTIDTIRLAERLERLRKERAAGGSPAPLVVLAQVNTTEEGTKSGVSPEALEPLLAALAGCRHLACRGLMTMAPGGKWIGDASAARKSFIMLRQLAERHAALFDDPSRVELSMGMSQDYRVAIEEGATMVRIGTALFEPTAGSEPPHTCEHE